MFARSDLNRRALYSARSATRCDVAVVSDRLAPELSWQASAWQDRLWGGSQENVLSEFQIIGRQALFKDKAV